MTSYSLFELNDYIRKVIALNFAEPIWVHCEISQVSISRGQVYLDLIEHDEQTDGVVAQSGAAIWYKTHLFLKKKLGELLDSLLQPGTKIQVKVKVEFHERYGMKLIIEDIDPAFTIGQMEMNRQKILERLKKENLIELNSYRLLPKVLQNIAVISSETAAGYKDFVNQLEENEFGYEIRHDLFQAAMQGNKTEIEVMQALQTIQECEEEYDCIIIIRGGGSKLDLASFDSYNIAHSISKSTLPVLVGIGHEIDTSVADVVAHKSLKTPTAVASFIVDRNASFESELLQFGQIIKTLVRERIEIQKVHLQQMDHTLKTKGLEIVKQNKFLIDQLVNNLKQIAKFKTKSLAEQLSYAEQLLEASDPKNVLKRGFSMVRSKGKLITSASELSKGDQVTIEYNDGSKEAEIQ